MMARQLTAPLPIGIQRPQSSFHPGRQPFRVMPRQPSATDISRVSEDYFQLRILRQPLMNSYLITLVVSVTLTDRDGKVLYENKNYVFRGQYQSTTDLPTFLDESPTAVDRMSRDFARALVADVLEGM